MCLVIPLGLTKALHQTELPVSQGRTVGSELQCSLNIYFTYVTCYVTVRLTLYYLQAWNPKDLGEFLF